jgi:hypothetical protein
MRRSALLAGGLIGALATGCASPEATRARGGGPGADPGNRRHVVEMHAGSGPYWRTPRLLARGAQGPAPEQRARPSDDGAGRDR